MAKKRQPEEVNVYDFAGKELGKVVPYGVYDLTHNQGWISVGIKTMTQQSLPLRLFADGGREWE